MTDLPRPPVLPETIALFLDFDGTLAAIQNDPETVALPPEGPRVLQGLNGRLGGALALISGRDVRDLSRRTPGTLWRLGGHGLEACAPGQAPAAEPPPAPDGLADALERIVSGLDGIRVEAKGPVFAVHFRSAPDLEPEMARRLDQIVAAFPGYRLERGKMIFETKPEGASKGAALKRMMGTAPFAGRVPVMVGDDTTDEAAMAMAGDLGGWSVKVGDGETVAQFRLGDPSDVWTWLREAAT